MRKGFAILALVVAAVVVIFVRALPEMPPQPPPNYSLMEEGLYMGGHVRSPPPGVHAVLNVSQVRDTFQAESTRWDPIADAPPAPSIEWLRKNVEFITVRRQAGESVFVHCDAGISRSGLVVVAYLMKEHGWTRDEAIAQARTKSEVHPNPAFMGLLAAWEKALTSPAGGEAASEPAG